MSKKITTNEEATKAMQIEVSRTNAGNRLWKQGVLLEEISRRVKVRVEDFDGEGGTVFTQLDGGEWVKEGKFKI